MNDIVTVIVDKHFDVDQRLARMRGWQNEYFSEDEQLQVRLRQLDGNKPLDVQRGYQISQLRKILILKQMREPLEVVMGSDQSGARLRSVRQHLMNQFASLSKMDRLRWLDNFLFIMTPCAGYFGYPFQKINNSNLPLSEFYPCSSPRLVAP